MNKFGKTFASGVAVCGFVLNGIAFADTAKQKEEAAPHHAAGYKHKSSDAGADLGGGWAINSTGGLSYVNPETSAHWFKLSGALRLDETRFMGTYRDKKNQFPSGALVRLAEIYFDGGVGENWEYTLTLGFAGSAGSKTYFGDTYLSYVGLLAERNQIFVGRVSGNYFGLESSNSTSWNPFLERSSQINAFYPGDGLGVMTDFWWNHGAVTLTAFQPDQNSNRLQDGASSSTNATAPYGARDRWTLVARATVAPVHDDGDVWHFGVSGSFREMTTVNTYTGAPYAGFSYGATPPARSRGLASGSSSILNTGSFRANNAVVYNVELARQMGPVMLEGEYTTAMVHRVQDDTISTAYNAQGDVVFSGWNIQARYLLTGEHHDYDVRDGNFGVIKDIRSRHGALEIAARYDFLNLNCKDIQGGTEHNATIGLNWFLNQQVRVSANYIRSSIHPSSNQSKRNLDILAARIQLRFK